MPAPSGATITGDIGPGIAVSAAALTDVTGIHFDFVKQTVVIDCRQGHPCYDVIDQTTITLTVASKVYTFTVS